MIAYKQRTKTQEAILDKLCDIASVQSYDLLPASISRKFSKIHYSKYLENSKLYQKLKFQFEDLQFISKNIFEIYNEKGKLFEKMKNCLTKIEIIFEKNSMKEGFITESVIDENSSGYHLGSTSRSDGILNEIIDHDFERKEAQEGQEIKEILDSAKFTNELNLMAIEEFNDISNNLELINFSNDEGGVMILEPEIENSVEEQQDENYEILDDIDEKIKMLEGWFKSELG